ncbi:MAG: phosphatidate cytidylyltransferase [Hyphomicrobiales bacterium]
MTSQMTVALLAQAIGTAFAVGTLLLLLLTLVPVSRATARQLWPVLGSEAAILAAGVLPWLLPPLALLACLLVAAARIGFESGSVHGLTAGRDFRLSHGLLLVAAAGLSWFAATPVFLWVAALVLAAAGGGLIITSERSLAGSVARFALFPLLPLAAFSHAASAPQLAPLLVLAFFLVEIFDSFSLLGGKLYGRTPLVPRLSPRKTWEGLATGIAATLTALLALTAWLGLPLSPMLLAGAIVVASAIAGDLLGSQAKRRAGVKDYPAVMTVQGGLLDIADAWLVAGPVLAGLASLFGWT